MLTGRIIQASIADYYWFVSHLDNKIGEIISTLKRKGLIENIIIVFTAYRNTIRAVRTDEWKLIRYPQINYTQLFNLKNDPLEIDNLGLAPGHKDKVAEMMSLLKEWYTATGDTMNLNPAAIKALVYDYTKLKHNPDQRQPEYILNKYFGESR